MRAELGELNQARLLASLAQGTNPKKLRLFCSRIRQCVLIVDPAEFQFRQIAVIQHFLTTEPRINFKSTISHPGFRANRKPLAKTLFFRPDVQEMTKPWRARAKPLGAEASRIPRLRTLRTPAAERAAARKNSAADGFCAAARRGR